MALDLASKQFVVASVPATHFGAGSVEKLPDVLRGTGCASALIVTDKALADTPVVAQVLETLAGQGIKSEMFARIRPNPTTDNVAAGAEAGTRLVRNDKRVAVV